VLFGERLGDDAQPLGLHVHAIRGYRQGAG
jgi:hypothetical protein